MAPLGVNGRKTALRWPLLRRGEGEGVPKWTRRRRRRQQVAEEEERIGWLMRWRGDEVLMWRHHSLVRDKIKVGETEKVRHYTVKYTCLQCKCSVRKPIYGPHFYRRVNIR